MTNEIQFKFLLWSSRVIWRKLWTLQSALSTLILLEKSPPPQRRWHKQNYFICQLLPADTFSFEVTIVLLIQW